MQHNYFLKIYTFLITNDLKKTLIAYYNNGNSKKHKFK